MVSREEGMGDGGNRGRGLRSTKLSYNINKSPQVCNVQHRDSSPLGRSCPLLQSAVPGGILRIVLNCANGMAVQYSG